MKIKIDTHTHSIASLHAYSTIDELAKSAKKARLSGFVLSEHGPSLQGYPHPYYFSNLRVLPSKIHGVRLFRGVELNILDTAGNIDLSPRELHAMHFVMAGLHEACFAPQSKDKNTEAIIAAIKNPYVDAISHPANPAFPADYGAIVEAAVSWGKALEINNSSFTVRAGSIETCPILAKICAEKNAFVCCGSDAHYHADVGNFRMALAVIKGVGIKPEQVVNRTLSSFFDFIEDRHGCRFR
jgi:putative hydrolase